MLLDNSARQHLDCINVSKRREVIHDRIWPGHSFRLTELYRWQYRLSDIHYGDVVMGTVSSHITSLTIVYSTVYSGADQRKHHSSASLACVRRIRRGPVNSLHKWPVTRKMFPFDDVIMFLHTLITARATIHNTGNAARFHLVPFYMFCMATYDQNYRKPLIARGIWKKRFLTI